MHTTLATRRLGTTDMEITTVGFGAWAVGGGDWAFGWGPQEDEQSLAPIRHAAVTVAEIAIAWTLAWPGVTAAIVGARTPEQVDGWIDAGSIELTRDDLEEIAKA